MNEVYILSVGLKVTKSKEKIAWVGLQVLVETEACVYGSYRYLLSNVYSLVT